MLRVTKRFCCLQCLFLENGVRYLQRSLLFYRELFVLLYSHSRLPETAHQIAPASTHETVTSHRGARSETLSSNNTAISGLHTRATFTCAATSVNLSVIQATHWQKELLAVGIDQDLAAKEAENFAYNLSASIRS